MIVSIQDGSTTLEIQEVSGQFELVITKGANLSRFTHSTLAGAIGALYGMARNLKEWEEGVFSSPFDEDGEDEPTQYIETSDDWKVRCAENGWVM